MTTMGTQIITVAYPLVRFASYLVTLTVIICGLFFTSTGWAEATAPDAAQAELFESSTGVSTTADPTPAKAEANKAKRNEVLVAVLTLKGAVSESVNAPGLLGDIQQNLPDVLRRLKQAGDDEKVSAVVLRLRNATLGRGKQHELRQAIAALRRTGKRVYAELRSGTASDYMLACACDQIVMPESGVLLLPGVRAEVVFYKDLFDKLGVKADMLQVGSYKGAAEPYTRGGMSAPFREQYERVVDDLYDQMVDTIATDRGLQRQHVTTAIDQGLFTAKDALKRKLIDKVAYPQDFTDSLAKELNAKRVKFDTSYGKKKVDTDFSGMTGMFKLIDLMTGGNVRQRGSRTKKVAIVYAVGTINAGRSSTSLLGGSSVGCDTIIAALRKAESDKTVVGTVLRIDSPGGSAMASDMIWDQVRRCDKPVVASMGDTAASGGYYIAMGCDKIFAEPGTLTGSIGVVGGKIAMGGIMNRLGVATEVVSRGKNSGVYSTLAPFSESERAVFMRSMQDIYEQFTSKAAEGRSMELGRLEAVAGGRIWTGRQAQRFGLVDHLGTLNDAIDAVRSLAKLDADEKTETLILPRTRSLFDQLFAPDVDAQVLPLESGISKLLGGADHELLGVYRLFDEPVLLWLPYRVQIR